MKKLLLLSLLLLFAFEAQAQLPEKFTEPIPLNTGEGASMEPNANHILFFPHPGVPDSAVNFQTALSQIEYGFDQHITAIDLLGTPGFPTTSVVKLEQENIDRLLTDPAGLCFENYLLNLSCERDWIVDPLRHQPSWQLLVADLRNLRSGEAAIAGIDPEVANVTLAGSPDSPPYDSFGLSSLIATLGEESWQIPESPHALCYDIAAAEDWIACPVFGKIFVRGYPETFKSTVGGHAVELLSPVIIYRLSSEDHRYHFAGYLANPISPLHYDLYDQDNPERRSRRGHALFPLSIAVGDFVESKIELLVKGGLTDIAVMGTATLARAGCNWAYEKLEEAGLERLPWGLDCTRGNVWGRERTGWTEPVREVFDASHVLVGAPKIYSMAAGTDEGISKLFAASNAPATDPDSAGQFYVLKYYDLDLVSHSLSGLGPLVPPRLIPVIPPGDDPTFGPFKIATAQINADDLVDFAITWKKSEDTLIDTDNQIWKGTYLPYFSLFLSRVAETGIVYDQFDFQVPNVANFSEGDPEAQIAAIAFGKKGEGEHYLVVGNNQRVAVEDGNYRAFVYVYPITGGLLDTLNIKVTKISFESGGADTPGVANLTTHPNSYIIGAAIRDPILRAPESCNISGGHGVYGYHWLGEIRFGGETISFLDADHDGVPNRCEACSLANPAGEDSDWDELPDVEGCDRCPGQPDLDLEINASGQLVGDNIPDGCDNCPAERCANYSSEFDPQDCINFSQADVDGDGVGNSCDGCPEDANLSVSGIYVSGDSSGCDDLLGGFQEGCLSSIEHCTHCVNGFINGSGQNVTELSISIYADQCEIRPISDGPIGGGEDVDGDGVPNARDNCIHVFNPPPAGFIGTSGNIPSGQPDSDRDGSGDACDCQNSVQGDDCDNDGVPNRFDRAPYNGKAASNQQPPDTVYDPYAGIIADRKDLIPAQGGLKILDEGISINTTDLSQFSDRIKVGPVEPQTQQIVCGYPDNTYPGPRPCHHMGRSGKEVTVILPSKTETPPPQPCVVGEDPACTLAEELPPTGGEGPTMGRNVAQYCIATVGRQNPKTAAIFDWEQAQVISANNRAQEITGIENFDIFVGAEGGIIHWECAFLAGAFTSPSVAQATEILPETSGAIAPYFLVQISGLPPIPYGRRPDPQLAIVPPRALLLAPLAGETAEEGAALSLSPALSQSLAGRQLQQLPSEGVQFGVERSNLHNKMVVKVLTSQSDFAAEGTYLAVGDLHSLISVDMKAPPEPSTFRPVEQRLDQPDSLLRALQDKVSLWNQTGRPITPEIYRGLPWEESMVVEFLVGQSTVSEAVVEANKSLSPDESELALTDDYVHQVFLPAYVKAPRFGVGGGCGCNIEAESFSVAWLLYLLCLVAPLPVLMYYRRRNK